MNCPTYRLVLLAGAAITCIIVAAASCDGAPSASDPSAGAQTGPLRDYAFRWTGDEADLPWNRTLYVETTDYGGRLQPATALIFFEGTPEMKIEARAGEEWFVASERAPNAAMRELLWMVARRGKFGDKDVFDLPLPRRAQVRLTGDEANSPGDDTITVAHEASGARLVAVRGGSRGLHFAIFDASRPPGEEDWRIADHRAPPRPWVWTELRPGGKFAMAAKCDGHQWLARRVELTPGAEVVFDVIAQPLGGGTVVCDDPRAELLLGGDIPIPALWLVSEFYRARWTNVPPGRHAVRYQDGEVVPFDVADGAEILLPKDADEARKVTPGK